MAARSWRIMRGRRAGRWSRNLNNDIIGNSCGSDGVCEDANVRVFSEGLRWQGGEPLRAVGAKPGGAAANDSPSRNLSRYPIRWRKS